MKKFILLILILLFPFNVFAQRGCCSHHGGVSGCNSYGRQTCNDGTVSPTCTCPVPVVSKIYGCTDPDAKNYNSNADINDGSCEYYVYGCTDSNAINYNSQAEKSDNSCQYLEYEEDIEEDNINKNLNYDYDDIKIEEDDSKSEDIISGLIGVGIASTAIGVYINKRKNK